MDTGTSSESEPETDLEALLEPLGTERVDYEGLVKCQVNYRVLFSECSLDIINQTHDGYFTELLSPSPQANERIVLALER